MRPHVFIGGVPGAGKTTLADAGAASGAFVRVGAGQLIKTALQEIAEDRVRVLDEANAKRNQSVLVTAFEAYCRSARLPVLLDGHFVVPTERGPDRVAQDVFLALQLDALVVVTTDPEVIAERLRSRPVRARWWDGTVAALEQLQAAELAAANEVATALAVPLTLLRGTPDEPTLSEVFSQASRRI